MEIEPQSNKTEVEFKPIDDKDDIKAFLEEVAPK